MKNDCSQDTGHFALLGAPSEQKAMGKPLNKDTYSKKTLKENPTPSTQIILAEVGYYMFYMPFICHHIICVMFVEDKRSKPLDISGSSPN